MLHTQQIEEAINHQLDSEHKNSGSGYVIMVDSKHYETLRFLAQEYLLIKGFPEQQEEIGLPSIDAGIREANIMLHKCKTAHAKNCRECRERVPTIKELNKIVRENEEYSSSDDRIATAIHTLITGKMKGEVR